jgi:hypothetical protein
MSREQLVEAYVDGSISRRTFVRRLVAAGVTAGAAVSYAHLLSPGRAHAQTAQADFYTPPVPVLDVRSGSVDTVVDKGKIKVLVTVEEASTIALVAVATAGGKEKVVADKVVDFPAAGEQLVKMKLTRAGSNFLEGVEKAKVTVFATAVDRQGSSADTSDTGNLK